MDPMPIIDVHTHMFTRHWLELLRAHGDPYGVQVRPDGREEIFRGATPVVFPQPGHFDYDLRLAAMDAAGIDVSIVSLTCPNVYWGGEAVSSEAARESNASMAEAQRVHQDRIRWFASLPWQYPARAVERDGLAAPGPRRRGIAGEHRGAAGGSARCNPGRQRAPNVQHMSTMPADPNPPTERSVVDSLILDLLEWIGPGPRPYRETMEAWRTSCPRLPVWEDATELGFIERHHDRGRPAVVTVSASGAEHLRTNRS
jgi:hypothetical protein